MSSPEHPPTTSPPPILTVEELGELLPGYQFEAFIDSGGMGSVYKARHRSLDRPVAIKLLRPEFGMDEEFRASFEREAKAMARLNHPNLVQVYDFGEIQNMLFIIMEYVEGVSLLDSCGGMALVHDEAAELVAGICRGLHHAHSHGILHRDIKPANILVDQSFTPKIVDFGIAEPMGVHYGEGAEVYTTPDYAAPESCYHGYTLDGRSDIYSVGILFYELLTGYLPTEDSAYPSETVGSPSDYDHIFYHATQADPDHRYADAEQFAHALDEVRIIPSVPSQTATLLAPTTTDHFIPSPSLNRRPVKKGKFRKLMGLSK